jgi:predicted nucleic acid-binding protein
MEHIVVDTNVIVASCLESEDFHQAGQNYITGLEGEDYVFHLPMLVVVEVMATINRRAQRNRLALLVTWKQNFADWERDGKLVLYPLDRGRMDSAANIAIRDRLKGPDSVIAALAEELGMTLRTFDTELQSRFQRAPV